MKRFSLLFLTLAIGLSIHAQSINVSYEIRSGGASSVDTVVVYMQSATASSVAIRAVNFSLAYDFNCSSYDQYSSIFPTYWDSFFQRHLIRRNLNLSYNGKTYDSRFLYAIGDAKLTSNSALVIPANTQPMIEVMKIGFTGSCTSDIYMEDQTENSVNQIADANLNSLGYNVFRLSGPPTLPLEYMSWEARPLPDGSAELTWSTSAEINNDYFIIEKSFVSDFSEKEDIQRVFGEGTPVDPASYTFIDNGLMQTTVYYRLKQVDLNGQWSYSGTQTVNFEQLSPGLTLTVFPNPARDIVKVQASFLEDARITLMLFDKKGRLVRTKVAEANAAVEFPLANLSPGIYHLQATSTHKGNMLNESVRLVITK
jgi:hypothetical protein